MIELLRQLAWIRPVADITKLVAFGIFVVLGWRASRGRRVDVFLGYTLLLSVAVGLVQHEAWPFARWALVHHAADPRIVTWELEGLDADGAAFEVDPAILHPLAPEEFGSWAFANLGRLPPSGRASVGRFLLARAEAGRRRFAGGGAVSVDAWLLGPLYARYHFLPGYQWRSPADVPATPFVRLRMWRLEWNALERYRGSSEVRRSLMLEWPPAARPPAS